MKRILLILLFVLLIFPINLEASQELIINPSSVSLKAFAGEYFGEVKATIIANEERVEKVELTVQGKNIDIPTKVYEYLEKPLLNTFQIRTERGYDEFPHLYVYLELAFKTKKDEWLPKKIHLDYYGGVIQAISIQTPEDKNNSSWDSIKL